jgi:transcriptional regulator with XRE-family HTH domain
VDAQTVARFLVRQGVALRPEGNKPVQVPLEELRGRYLAGESLSDLAEGAGVSQQTIGRRLRAAGVQMRPHREKTASHRQKIAASRRADIPEGELRRLHAEGMSCREIGTALGWHEEAIRMRLIELGLERLPAKARPEKNYFWQGGYSVDEDGYILEKRPDHPQATAGGYVRQHRLVMEKVLGRYLTLEEVVDHKNRDTSDNDPGNLELYPTNAAHLAATLTGVKLPREERERLKREAVLRARQRVAAILAASGNGAGQSP